MTKRPVGIDKFHHELTTIEMEPHLTATQNRVRLIVSMKSARFVKKLSRRIGRNSKLWKVTPCAMRQMESLRMKFPWESLKNDKIQLGHGMHPNRFCKHRTDKNITPDGVSNAASFSREKHATHRARYSAQVQLQRQALRLRPCSTPTRSLPFDSLPQ